MEIIKKYEDGPILVKPSVFYDGRGYFYESFNAKQFNDKVAKADFVQDNQSQSDYGTIRGMHFQKGEHAQAKLVRVVKGAVVDVVVDIRPDSKYFGKVYTAYLSEENKYQFFVPRGFAHGFVALEDGTIFQYKCDNYYCKESEGSFNFETIPDFDWNDYVPYEKWKVSDKDKAAPKFSDSDFSSFEKRSEVDIQFLMDFLNERWDRFCRFSITDEDTETLRKKVFNELNKMYLDIDIYGECKILSVLHYKQPLVPAPDYEIIVRQLSSGKTYIINDKNIKLIKKLYRKGNKNQK